MGVWEGGSSPEGAKLTKSASATPQVFATVDSQFLRIQTFITKLSKNRILPTSDISSFSGQAECFLELVTDYQVHGVRLGELTHHKLFLSHQECIMSPSRRFRYSNAQPVEEILR